MGFGEHRSNALMSQSNTGVAFLLNLLKLARFGLSKVKFGVNYVGAQLKRKKIDISLLRKQDVEKIHLQII